MSIDPLRYRIARLSPSLHRGAYRLVLLCADEFACPAKAMRAAQAAARTVRETAGLVVEVLPGCWWQSDDQLVRPGGSSTIDPWTGPDAGDCPGCPDCPDRAG